MAFHFEDQAAQEKLIGSFFLALMANIGPDDAMILAHAANPEGSNFRKGQGIGARKFCAILMVLMGMYQPNARRDFNARKFLARKFCENFDRAISIAPRLRRQFKERLWLLVNASDRATAGRTAER
jgi:hypothetical protein